MKRKLNKEEKDFVEKIRQLFRQNPEEWFNQGTEEEFNRYLTLEPDLSFLDEIKELGNLFDELKNRTCYEEDN